MRAFGTLFEDCTHAATKIKKEDYLSTGRYPIIDQGQSQVVGYTDSEDGVFEDVPAIIFGDHTRKIKYVDEPFFLGADGVKLLKCKEADANYKYLYYALSHVRIPDTGYNRHFKWLKETEIEYPDQGRQEIVVSILDKLSDIIGRRNEELQALDTLIKARFVEMFGTEKEVEKWPSCTVGDVADVCVGVVIKPTQYYTSNGIPAFRSLNVGEMTVKDENWIYFTEEGHQKNQKSVIRENDVLVVRSGAPGKACVASKKYAGYNAVDIIIAHPKEEVVNPTFLAMFTNMPHGMNQIREKTGGAAQQHFNVGGYKMLNLILPPMELQEDFVAFVTQVDKSKAVVQKSLDEAQLLFDSLMQEYFG